MELQWQGWADYSVTHDGESYFSNDGSRWTDGAAMTAESDEGTKNVPMNACIKAFVNTTSGLTHLTADSSVGKSIDGLSVAAMPTDTISGRDIEDRNPVKNEDSYTGRVISQVVVDNDGNPLSEGTEVELNLAYIDDLHHTYLVEASKWGVREKTGSVDGLFPVGFRPARFFESDGLLFPVYGPVLAKVDAEGRVTIDADNLVNGETGAKFAIPEGYYDVVYATAGADVVGSLRVIKITAAGSSGCDVGLTGWLALGLAGIASVLLRRR